MSNIQTRPRGNGFGAEVTGLAPGRPLEPEDAQAIRQALARFGVIWFPGLGLDVERLEAFSSAIGPFGHDPYVKAMDGHPHVLELRREPDEKSRNFGAGWHSDWSFQDAPPMATILQGTVIPPVGGDTLFADGAAAYEALSPAFREMIDGLLAVHSAILPYGPNGSYATEAEARSMKILSSTEAEKTRAHPLVRTHPDTGRKALFISPTYTIGIDGFSKDESAALLGFLFRHMVEDRFVYRHHWAAGMLTMWDNRWLTHYADGGYDGHLRVMYRTTVAGTVPV